MPDAQQAPVAATLGARDLVDIASDVARRAAEHIRNALGSATTVGAKSTPTDLVTSTDLEVEAFVRDELLTATPDASIVGEEGTVIEGGSDIGWIVDPLDGTVNFIYDLPVIAVSIAASVDGSTVAGAIADVVRQEVFTAYRGGGARLDGQAVSVSGVDKIGDALIGTGFSYTSARRAEEAETIQRILPVARDIRCFGSAALNLAWVACGRLDGYWEGETNHWDVAAGSLIAGEAGADVEIATPGGSGSVLAATPGITAALRTLVSD